MTTSRDKTEFTRKLKGEPIGYDSWGRAIIEGDILLFAATVGQAAEMRVIKVTETLADKSGRNVGSVKFRIKRAERGWGENATWTLQERTSIITKLKNTYLLTDPPQELIDLFDEETD